MTNKEAIRILKQHLHHWECLLESTICTKKEGEETIEALKMAIMALEEAQLDIKLLKMDLPELFRPSYDGGYLKEGEEE